MGGAWCLIVGHKWSEWSKRLGVIIHGRAEVLQFRHCERCGKSNAREGS